jgi:hypothetical protein
LDFPEPLGPTTTVTPVSKSSDVFSANDLKPLIVSDFRNKRLTPPPRADPSVSDPLCRIVATSPPDAAEAASSQVRGSGSGLRDAGVPDRQSAVSASTDPEAHLRRGVPVERKLVANLDLGDPGAGRSFVAPRDDPGDGVSISFEHRFHTAVGEILHPTVDAGSARFVRATLAEPHVLHAARHPEVPPDPQT